MYLEFCHEFMMGVSRVRNRDARHIVCVQYVECSCVANHYRIFGASLQSHGQLVATFENSSKLQVHTG